MERGKYLAASILPADKKTATATWLFWILICGRWTWNRYALNRVNLSRRADSG